MRRLGARTNRGLAVTVGTVLLAGSVVVVSLPSLAGIFIGLGFVTFAFLGTHSLLSGWVVDCAKRRGIGTAQASSAYLLTYYLGSTVAGVLATQQWQLSGMARRRGARARADGRGSRDLDPCDARRPLTLSPGRAPAVDAASYALSSVASEASAAPSRVCRTQRCGCLAPWPGATAALSPPCSAASW